MNASVSIPLWLFVLLLVLAVAAALQWLLLPGVRWYLRRKVRGDCITLALIDEHFDRFVSTDVLEHLTENDIRACLAYAADRERRLFTRPA